MATTLPSAGAASRHGCWCCVLFIVRAFDILVFPGHSTHFRGSPPRVGRIPVNRPRQVREPTVGPHTYGRGLKYRCAYVPPCGRSRGSE
jgi:hypothetical protein